MKGQINLEFLFAGIIYLTAIGGILIAGTNVLPDLSTDVKRSNLYSEAYTVSTKLLSKPGYSSYSDTTNWDKNDSTVAEVKSIGLSSSADNYMVVEPEKLEKLEDFSSADDRINYSTFKDITGAENQYRFNFTWMPIGELNGSFKRFETSYFAVSDSDSLVANWKLDEENSDSDSGPESIVRDSSGHDNDGTAYGNFGYDQPGIRGTSSYYFDSQEYVEINQGYSDNETTVSMWIKPEFLAGDQKALRIGGNGKNWSIQVNDGSVTIGYTDSGGSEEIYSSGVKRSWSHVSAVVEDNGEYKLYVNGKLKGSGISRKNFSDIDPSEVIIGAGDRDRSESNEEGFRGYIDDVRIYNESLNGDAIKKIHEGSDPYTRSAVNRTAKPSGSSYRNAGNLVRFGRERIGSTYPHLLSISHNGVYDQIYVSNTWNFTGRTPIEEGETFNFQGETFRLKTIQNQGDVRGNAIVLQQNLKSFGPESSPDKSVITLERFAVYKDEPLKVGVLSW